MSIELLAAMNIVWIKAETACYFNTMDILLDDETYEEILRLEAVER